MLDGREFTYPNWANSPALTKRWTGCAKECLANMRSCGYNKDTACQQCTVQLPDLKYKCHMFDSVLSTYARHGEPVEVIPAKKTRQEIKLGAAYPLLQDLLPELSTDEWRPSDVLYAVSGFYGGRRYFASLLRALVQDGVLESKRVSTRVPEQGHYLYLNYYRLTDKEINYDQN